MANYFLGAPYPIEKDARGYFHTQDDLDQVKSDLLVLLLTNPGERVMMPDYGTPLRELLFEPNNSNLVDRAKQMISNSIRKWEPRIAVSAIDVSSTIDTSSLSPMDDGTQTQHILSIRIAYADLQNITQVQELVLELPIGSS